MAPKLQRQNATTVAAIFDGTKQQTKSEDMRSEIFAPKRPFAVGALLRVKDTTKYHSLLQQINVTYADEIDHSIWHVILTSKPYRFFIATCIIVNTFLLGYSIDLRPGLEKEIVDTTNNIINVVEHMHRQFSGVICVFCVTPTTTATTIQCPFCPPKMGGGIYMLLYIVPLE